MKPIAEKGMAAQVRHRLGGLCHPPGVYRTIPARVNPRKNGKMLRKSAYWCKHRQLAACDDISR